MDIYHPEAQKDRAFRVINPDSLDETVSGSPPGVWTNYCTPADEACFRVDHEHWLGTLSPRRRRIAELLTDGHGTLEVGARDRRDAGRDQPVEVLVARELAEVSG